MELLHFKNEALKNHSNIILEFNEQLKETSEELQKILIQKDLNALAAPVVGHPYNMIVFAKRILRYNTADMEVMINPKIILSKAADNILLKEEKCVLFPFIKERVLRFNEIDVKFQNLEGKIIKKKLDGFMSRLVQHEVDHLDGILIIDRLPEPILKQYRSFLD